MMRLPNQTKAIVHKTYNANAVTVGVNTSMAIDPMMNQMLYRGLDI
ncbi:MAG: hypothetical protein AAF617_04970 [Bacteroidota bacterium]